MKTLYIIRHAKSSWKNLELDDFERPLNKRGKKNAPFMADVLKAKNVKPELIISSPALRAKRTAQTIAKALNYFKEIVYLEQIYEASASTLERIVKNVGDEHNVAFLFGHNPGLNMLVEKYVAFEENIPTCGIVEIKFSCESWSQANKKNAEFISFEYPKKI